MNTQIDFSVFSTFPILETERLVLREFTFNDAFDLFRIRGDQETMAYMDAPMHHSIDDTRSMIEEIDLAFQGETGINWVLESKFNGRMLGYIGYWRIMPEHVRGELGYALNRRYWGKGLMKEAAFEIIKFGFGAMRLHSIEANVNPGNKASIRLLQKLGFKKEGYLKENYFVNENFVDTLLFSLLEQDFAI